MLGALSESPKLYRIAKANSLPKNTTNTKIVLLSNFVSRSIACVVDRKTCAMACPSYFSPPGRPSLCAHKGAFGLSIYSDAHQVKWLQSTAMTVYSTTSILFTHHSLFIVIHQMLRFSTKKIDKNHMAPSALRGKAPNFPGAKVAWP